MLPAMSSLRAAVAAPVAVLIALWLRLAWVYPDLPERIPMHFGPSGAADRWAGPREFLLFNALFPALMLGLLLGAGLLAARLPPRLVNLPNRDYWLAPERLAETRAKLLVHLAAIATLTLALFAAVAEVTLSVARSGGDRLPALFFWAFGFYLAGVGAAVVSLLRGFGAAAVGRRRAADSTGLGRR